VVKAWATSRKVPGSITGVAGHLTNPCALGQTQPLKVSTRISLGVKAGRCVRLTNCHLHVPTVKKSGGLNLLESCGPVRTCNGNALPFT
jgi:hypothetical protein